MKFLDLFAGIGGFRLGLEAVGFQCVGYVEWDKFARLSYEAIHDTEGEWTAHDITSVSDENIRLLSEKENIEIICGGFPCQAFSIAGRRGGFDDVRGTMFFEIARFAKQIKPRFLLLENVKGLLSHDKGKTFATILNTLDELGYDAEWQVLNSKDFGVPQNRERVFIIGHLRGECTRKIFPISGNGEQVNTKIKKIGNIRKKGLSQSGDVFDPRGLSPTLCSTTTQKDPVKIITEGLLDIKSHDSNRRVYNPNGIAPTLNTCEGGNWEPKIVQAVLSPERIEKQQNGRRIKEDGEPMFTLTAQDRHGVAILRPTRTEFGKKIRKSYENGEIQESRHNMTKLEPRPDGICNTITTVQKDNYLKDGYRIRKLTPRECWRLQGFPDWAFDRAQVVNSNSQLYKQAGNSVTVNVIQVIAERLVLEFEDWFLH